MPVRQIFFTLILLIAAAPASLVRADEGMWLFGEPPAKLLKQKYGFDATDAWLAHLRQSAVRFNNGGSGSFVSPEGLVMTNHHVGADAIEKLSTKQRDLLASGFHARTKAEEIPCADSELNVLVSIQDVTQRVEDAVKPAKTPVEAEKLRRAVLSTIEKESLDQTGLRSDVVTLYHGGLYCLYCYKKYTDVRLVFAPEQRIANFGGDPNNFEYPRYSLDISFFRVYENGQPAKTPHYLRWNPTSLRENDLVFIAGHPGHTRRMLTVRHLESVRDCELPRKLDRARRREVALISFSQRSAENARRAKKRLLGVQNGRKARTGGLASLQDPAVMALKRAEEDAFRWAVARRPELADECEAAVKEIDESLQAHAAIRDEYAMLEGAEAFQCSLFSTARTLVRMAEELPKPNAERLREYRDSNLDSLRASLFSPAPIYNDLETLLLADSLGLYLEQDVCGRVGDDPLVEEVMAGKGPQARAAELVRGSKLADLSVRRQLASGGLQAIEASDDPMIRLARLVDEPARRVRAIYEQQVTEPQTAAYGRLAKARFALFGITGYPDATFTLRLSFGLVKRCEENGVPAPAWTTFADLYRTADEHGNAVPFRLPASWIEHREQLNPDTPLNFISTADIIGGNSGSPVVNRDGQLVGIVFDGDLPSLVWDYLYTQPEGRAITVHGSAILEALQKVYDAKALVDELNHVKPAG